MPREKRIITRRDFERLQDLSREKGGNGGFPKVLKERLSRARLVNGPDIKPSIVTMNSRIKLKDIGNGKDEIMTLVYPVDSDPSQNCVSVLDPMGSELLGKEVGEVISWNRNAETCYFLVADIVYQPEANGEYNL